MNFELQPEDLKSELIYLKPIHAEDFDKLFAVASDPLIWEQHPDKERYKREVFQKYFDDALECQSAFIVYDAKTNNAIGSSRFYNLNEEKKSVMVGYTFLAKEYWGGIYNHSLKQLMLTHAFKYIDSVIFQIGANNIRSQKAVVKLGAKKLEEQEWILSGEVNSLHFFYELRE